MSRGWFQRFGGGFWKGRGYGSGGFHGGDLLLLFRLVGDAELFLHLHAEFVGGAAKFAHEFAQLTGELGQLLRTEEKQGEYGNERCFLETHE